MIAYVKNSEKLLLEWEFNRFLKTGNGLSINFFGLPGTGKRLKNPLLLPYFLTFKIRIRFFLHQIFPFILNRKPPTFSFSEAPEKKRRVKRFFVASSQFL